MSSYPVVTHAAPGGAGRAWHACRVATKPPASTFVLVIGIMATASSFGDVIIFTPRWYWYMIPVVIALPEVGILFHRWQRRRQLRRDLRTTLQELG